MDDQAIHAQSALIAARAYRRRGWSVIPIRPRSKLPLLPWEEFQHRLASEDEITDWFAREPKGNVGIVTGTISRLAVLDIDPEHGGLESLKQLEAEHGKFPATAVVETGGGGRHYYFAAFLPRLRNRAALWPGVDLRAEGGMIVAPPSVHPTGRRYRWLHDPTQTEPVPMPHWLVEAALNAGHDKGHPLGFWRNLVRSGIGEGARNTTLASLAGHLLWHGVDPEVAKELLLCWNRVRCHPPLDDDEVVAVATSIAQLHARQGQTTP